MNKWRYSEAFKCVGIILSIIFFLFLIMALLLHVVETEPEFLPDCLFPILYALLRCIKNAGSYSVLLTGIAVTVILQFYANKKDIEKEMQVKVNEIGYYALGFLEKDPPDSKKSDELNYVVLIKNQYDYYKKSLYKNNTLFTFHFYTSKEKKINLKNILAFEGKYFDKNKRKILKKYYEYCEKIEHNSPIFSTATTTDLKNKSDSISNFKEENNDYSIHPAFYSFQLCTNFQNEDDGIKTFWISAVTEEGILLFIKVKAFSTKLTDLPKDESGNIKVSLALYQQTTYYKIKNKLHPLYR